LDLLKGVKLISRSRTPIFPSLSWSHLRKMFNISSLDVFPFIDSIKFNRSPCSISALVYLKVIHRKADDTLKSHLFESYSFYYSTDLYSCNSFSKILIRRHSISLVTSIIFLLWGINSTLSCLKKWLLLGRIIFKKLRFNKCKWNYYSFIDYYLNI